MNKKLTLLLDESTIKRAKQYAEKRRQSLSQLVETYFRYLTNATRPTRLVKSNHKSIVNQLSGIVSIPEKFDHRAEYHQHRAEKALHG